MISNLIFMNGYGFYVWLSFAITLGLCSIVYFKTKKTIKKYEKEFLNELKNLSEQEKREVLKKSKVLSQISRTLLQQQIEGIGDFTEEGTFTYGTLAVEVFESEEGLVINILDTSTGEQTQVIVPNQ